MALEIIYDRNFRRGTEKETTWHINELLPDLDPHRVIELHATGDEKTTIENIMGGWGNNRPIRLYGDIARTVWINLLAEIDTEEEA